MTRRAAVVLVLLAGLLAAAAPACARSPLEFAMADDGALLGPAAADNAAAWRAFGVDAARLQVSWSRVAPNPRDPVMPPGFQPFDPDDTRYDWSVIDEEVTRLVAAGIRPILMLDGPTPLWASSAPALGNQRYPPVGEQFAAFAAAVAHRYGRDVREYIIWNEPNLPLWLQPQATCVQRRCTPASPGNYRLIARAAYPAIHAADADATVLIGALAPRGTDLTSRNATMRPMQFLRALGCVDDELRPVITGDCAGFEPAIADGFTYHPHSTRQPPDEPYDHPDDANLASLPRVERLLDRLQAAGRLTGTTRPLGIWLDEYGYQTDPPDGERGVTPGEQDRYLQQATYLAWRDPRVQLIAQYAWRDERVGGGAAFTGWQSGLFDVSGGVKPALTSLDDPFWVDLEGGTLWGQVRPGGVHTVRVEVRRAGSWRPLGRVTTGPDGTWALRARLVKFAAYRALSEYGSSSTRVAAPSFPPTEAAADTDRTVGSKPGGRIPPSFAGLSIEYGSVARSLDSRAFARLMGGLRTAGGAAPTLRLGGATSPGATQLTSAWLRRLRAWERRVPSPLVLGLNFADAANADRFAQAAVTGLPARSLAAFEIGHEPDRSASYDFTRYRADLGRYVADLAATARGVPISGGGFASPASDDYADDLLGGLGAVGRVYALHASALRRCDGGSVTGLLSDEANVPIVARAAQLVAVAATHRAAVRVSQLDSAPCGGRAGVSDTFASALWATDTLFALARAGVRNVNFATTRGSPGAAVEVAPAGARVRPLFYGLLLFARAAPRGSQLLAVEPRPAGSTLRTWATKDRAGTRRIVVINKDAADATAVTLHVAGRARRATLERLTAPSLRARRGVTFAGQGYGTATDGVLRGRRLVTRAVVRGGRLRVPMPAASAALITVTT